MTGSPISARSVSPAGVLRQPSLSRDGVESLMSNTDFFVAAGTWHPAAGAGVQSNVVNVSTLPRFAPA